MRLPTALGLVSALALAVAGAGALDDDRPPTATPLKHVVVIFQENVSFDHYFGTYPNALNLSVETPFMSSPRTPRINNLVNPLDVNNNFATHFGPSTPAVLILISGEANGCAAMKIVLDPADSTGKTLLRPTHEAFGDASKTPDNITEIGDGDPLGDVCSNPTLDQVTMAGKNIGDLLNEKGITWGAFMGGFDLSVVNPPHLTHPEGTTGCLRATDPTAPGIPQSTSVDYIAPPAWFQYYQSTSNPTHARPGCLHAIPPRLTSQ